MYGEARTRVQLLVAYMTLEVFRLLMLHENFLIVKLAIAVPKLVS